MIRHVVLIPGFAGFDALGQVEYYAGVTSIFQKAALEAAGAEHATLHYFDNLPTAGVATRAARLKRYLAKRIARGEIQPNDQVALIGHSTGGLDIRRLLCDLQQEDRVVVDGGAKVAYADIRPCIQRVVFLSVPHRGTNIADWVQSHPWLRQLAIAKIRAAVCGSQVLVVDEIEQSLAGAGACLTDSDLLRAVRDALREANEHYGEPAETAPERQAEAHEAAAQLALYFRHMASDFRAIDDLASKSPDGDRDSPAHFSVDDRLQETAWWKDIQIRSYLTVGTRPFRFRRGRHAPEWNLANPCSYPEIAKDFHASAGTDLAYRICYRACAGGPFHRRPPKSAFAKRIGDSKVLDDLGLQDSSDLELWDNDGIVNTLSMVWPDVPRPHVENVLVACDHLDIVGHFTRERVKDVPDECCLCGKGTAREYRSYDALRSACDFSRQDFQKIWEEIFRFCL